MRYEACVVISPHNLIHEKVNNTYTSLIKDAYVFLAVCASFIIPVANSGFWMDVIRIYSMHCRKSGNDSEGHSTSLTGP